MIVSCLVYFFLSINDSGREPSSPTHAWDTYKTNRHLCLTGKYKLAVSENEQRGFRTGPTQT